MKELSEFVRNFQAERDGLRVARKDDAFVGSIAIDGRGARSQGARLRWFIVVLDFQGTGIGNALSDLSVDL
jgi:predicted N-acetyltransferase YhbS